MPTISNASIGRVVSLSGSQIVSLIQPRADEAGGDEQPTNLQIGALVRIPTGPVTIICMVSGLSIPMPSVDNPNSELKICELEMIGEVLNDGPNAGHFRRGISVSPNLGASIEPTSTEDMALVYTRPDRTTIEIGRIHQEATLPAYAVVDKLLGRHFAILGSTGCGKSCALAVILRKVIEVHDNAHILLLDLHGEYAHGFQGQAECIEPGDLHIPHWLFNFEEITEIIFGNEKADYAYEITLLRELIQRAKTNLLADDIDYTVNTDTPVPYKIGDINRMIDDEAGKIENRNDILPYLRIKSRLNAVQNDTRFAFIFQGSRIVRDNMVQVLSRFYRVPVDGKPISILNLSGVPAEILNAVVSVLCRMTFDFALWGNQSVPMLLVCEEVHKYAPAETDGFEPAKRALPRIAKEGRKYGLSLGVITQRPSELDPTILSQCNSMFAMRMTSERDQDIIKATLSDISSALIESLPSLGDAEAVVVGDATAVPMRVSFSRLPIEKQPRSATAEFSKAWKSEGVGLADLEGIVERWRRQRH